LATKQKVWTVEEMDKWGWTEFCNLYFVQNTVWGNQVKDDAVGRACGKQGRDKKYTHLKGGDKLGKLGMCVRIILKWIYKYSRMCLGGKLLQTP
jgi:hypothetical protein